MAGVDPELVKHLARLSPGGQRWLKTALQTIRTSPVLDEQDALAEPEPQRRVEAPPARPPEPQPEEPRVQPASSLEDVIEGRAKLDDQLDAYPELAEELEGLGEIIDLLRGVGESRRRRGEQILREEILGDKPEDESSEPEEEA